MTATTTPSRRDVSAIVAQVRNLPSLPAVVRKLLMLLEDPDTSGADIERVVSTDSALAARVLKLANSPLYKGVEPVATISQAFMRLGLWKLRDVAIGVSTTGTLSEMADDAVQTAYWHHALFTATCARNLAVAADMPLPEQPFVTGLLHDVGDLVFAAVAPEDYARYAALGGDARREREEEIFGTTHPRLGSLLLREWNLPKPLCDTVRLHHNTQVITSRRAPAISIVALADMLWKLDRRDNEPSVSARSFFTVARRAGVPLEELAAVLRRVDEQIDGTRRDLEIAGDVSFLAARRPERFLRVAVATGREDNTAWLEQGLAYLGHTVVPVADFVNAPTAGQLVITDAKALGPGLDMELEAALLARRARVVALAEGEDGAPPTLDGTPLPEIGFFLDAAELARHARGR